MVWTIYSLDHSISNIKELALAVGSLLGRRRSESGWARHGMAPGLRLRERQRMRAKWIHCQVVDPASYTLSSDAPKFRGHSSSGL